jgi:hypothetical protein
VVRGEGPISIATKEDEEEDDDEDVGDVGTLRKRCSSYV